MLVLLAIAAIAVLYFVVTVSQGRGGELVEFPPDVPPVELPEPGQLTAADFADLHLPMSLVGYHTQIVDETLQRAATAIGRRDTHIAVLERRVEELLAGRIQARQESYVRPSWAPIASPEPEPPVAPHETAEALFGAIGPHTSTRALSAEPPAEAPAEQPAGPSTEERGPFEEPDKREPATPVTQDRGAFETPSKERGALEAPSQDEGVSGASEAPAEDRGAFEEAPKDRGAFEAAGGRSGSRGAAKRAGRAAGERPDPEDAP
ncbi:hypothetical protein [Sphaerisporangium krabiense]|uniref:DivIVA domain-containing protein n=1 Tax=Sphaerisporangium krabiense TaxID=763782 RepID=A0A7W9DRM2_9ACTN|nr:hypothetical protein [Sphaerisporangium krabiense]MBB5627520.1 hypothetical protein [Sphaerisporangium krabiense]